jgi:hypothetical protein
LSELSLERDSGCPFGFFTLGWRCKLQQTGATPFKQCAREDLRYQRCRSHSTPGQVLPVEFEQNIASEGGDRSATGIPLPGVYSNFQQGLNTHKK